MFCNFPVNIDSISILEIVPYNGKIKTLPVSSIPLLPALPEGPLPLPDVGALRQDAPQRHDGHWDEDGGGSRRGAHEGRVLPVQG